MYKMKMKIYMCVISASGLAFRMVRHTHLRVRDD
jgi:hypothetical protein